jgi:hypothetical protein
MYSNFFLGKKNFPKFYNYRVRDDDDDDDKKINSSFFFFNFVLQLKIKINKYEKLFKLFSFSFFLLLFFLLP